MRHVNSRLSSSSFFRMGGGFIFGELGMLAGCDGWAYAVMLALLLRGLGVEFRACLALWMGMAIAIGGTTPTPDVPPPVLEGHWEAKGHVVGCPRISSSGWFAEVALVVPVKASVILNGKGAIPVWGEGEQVAGTWRFRTYFSSEQRHQGKRQRVVARVRPGEWVHTGATSMGGVFHRIGARMRAQIWAVFEAQFSETGRAFSGALVLGEGRLIPPYIRDRFAAMGISHLLAVSGLHMALVGALFWWCGGYLYSWTGGKEWARVIRLAGVAAISVVYFFLTPGTVATTRAVWMVCGALLCLAFRRKVGAIRLLSWVALWVVVWDPESIGRPGAQLSFCAVLGLIVGAKRLQSSEGAIALRGWLTSLVVPWVVTLPLVAFWFGVVPWLGPLINGFAIPIFGFLLLPYALFLGVASLVAPAWVGALAVPFEWGLDGLVETAVRLDSFVPVTGVSSFAWPWLLALLPLGLACVGGRRRATRLWCGLGLVGALLSFTPVFPSFLDLHFFDVGHGDALYFRDGSRGWLVDGGSERMGWGRVVPSLRRLGACSDLQVVLTHGDEDHLGGLFPVLERCGGTALYWNGVSSRNPRVYHLLATSWMARAPPRVVRKGDRWRVGAAGELLVVAPSREEEQRLALRRNDSSLILRLGFGAFSLLLMGDVEADRERELLAGVVSRGQTLLKVGHHGSRTSTSPELLHATSPWGVVVSSAGNALHPEPSVLRRIQRQGAKIWRTDLHGDIRIVTDGDRILVRKGADY